jgi:hypothetical protein
LIVGAWGADPSNESKAGKSYVIFGKTDNTATNLSAIASGTGGFVINGENADDYSGFIVSTAGDVNSDGLDDLIDLPLGSAPSELTIKSSKPSPLTSPAVETEEPLKSSPFSPLMTARMRVIRVATQSLPQAMSTVMAWMI